MAVLPNEFWIIVGAADQAGPVKARADGIDLDPFAHQDSDMIFSAISIEDTRCRNGIMSTKWPRSVARQRKDGDAGEYADTTARGPYYPNAYRFFADFLAPAYRRRPSTTRRCGGAPACSCTSKPAPTWTHSGGHGNLQTYLQGVRGLVTDGAAGASDDLRAYRKPGTSADHPKLLIRCGRRFRSNRRWTVSVSDPRSSTPVRFARCRR